MTGRPSTFNPEIATEICERLAGGEPLRAICRDEHMPHWSTVYDWIAKDKELSLRIARAREVGYDAIAEEALEIADTPEEGERTERSADGYKVVCEDMLGHRKLRVDTRLKLLAKWSPKKYGDRTAMELTGADGGPVQVSDTERAAKIAAILDAAKRRKAESDVDDLL